jgi:hypothetical protein
MSSSLMGLEFGEADSEIQGAEGMWSPQGAENNWPISAGEKQGGISGETLN